MTNSPHHRLHEVGEFDNVDLVRRYVQRLWWYLHGFSLTTGGPVERIIDIGCGDAYLGELAVGDAYSYTGIEPYPSDHEVMPKTDRFEVHHVTPFGFFDNYHGIIGDFDLAVFNHSLEHMCRPIETVQIAFQMLRPFGYVFVNVPHASAPWAWELDGHITMFNEAIIQRMFERTGFEVVDQFTVCYRRDCVELWTMGKKR